MVFVDEIDSLFGVPKTGGALAHRGVVTEFTSEMDGLHSSSRDRRMMVVEVTKRPFDLDDAVLGIDLPDEEWKDRKSVV